MMQQSSSLLDYKTKVIEPVGLGEDLLGINGARKDCGVLTWTCTQSQTNYFAPTKQRGCQSLRLAEHK